MKQVKIKELEYHIKNKKIVSIKNMEFTSSNIYCIKGDNGSGKSSLLKLIAGMDERYDGEIDYIDIDKIGFLGDFDFFFKYKSGYSNLRLSNIDLNEQFVKNLITRFNMEDNLNKKVSRMSLGMKKKLGLIIVLSKSNDLLLLDEPYNSLDKKSSTELSNILNETINNRNKIVVFSSHLEQNIEPIIRNTIYYEIT